MNELTPSSVTQPVVESLTWFERELSALVELFGPGFVLRVVIGALLSLAAYRAMSAMPRVLWRLGLDRGRRSARVGSLIGIALFVLGLLWTGQPLMNRAPGSTLLGSGAVALLLAVGAPGFVQSLMVGTRLAARGRLGEGQQIEIGEIRGSVRRIGLLATTLRTPGGATVHVPNHMFAKRELKVLRAQNAALLEVEVHNEASLTDDQLDRVVAAVHLSPYRRAGTKPFVDETGRDEGVLKIQFQTWATRDPEVVRRALRRMMLACLEVEDAA